MTHLYLWQNNLTGEIPTELGNLKNLQQFDLSKNQLRGTIPSELGSLTNLEFFNLNQNQLSGSILSEFGNMTSLKTLGLGDNNLTGTIPIELGNLRNLTELGLSKNQLCGEVPSSFNVTNLPTLNNLNLANNSLSASDVNVVSFLDSFSPGWTNGWENQQTPTDDPSCPNARPIPPTNPTATAFSSEQINLAWTDASKNETGFKIERNNRLIQTTAANVDIFADSGLKCGIEYNYSVQATNTYGDSQPITASATTLSCPPTPTPPSDLTTTTDSRTKTTLTWVDNSDDETGFVIERDDNLIATTAANVTSFVDTDLTCNKINKTFEYTLKATNVNGDSDIVSTTLICPKEGETDCEQVTTIPQLECEALLALYHNTDGPNWIDSPANLWNTTDNPWGAIGDIRNTV